MNDTPRTSVESKPRNRQCIEHDWKGSDPDARGFDQAQQCRKCNLERRSYCLMSEVPQEGGGTITIMFSWWRYAKGVWRPDQRYIKHPSGLNPPTW